MIFGYYIYCKILFISDCGWNLFVDTSSLSNSKQLWHIKISIFPYTGFKCLTRLKAIAPTKNKESFDFNNFRSGSVSQLKFPNPINIVLYNGHERKKKNLSHLDLIQRLMIRRWPTSILLKSSKTRATVPPFLSY